MRSSRRSNPKALVYLAPATQSRIIEVDMGDLSMRPMDFAPTITAPGELAVDPLRRLLFVSAIGQEEFFSGPAFVTVDAISLTQIGAPLIGDENRVVIGADPSNDRVWTGWGQMIGCGLVQALQVSAPTSLGFAQGCAQDPGSWTVSPATGRVYLPFYAAGAIGVEFGAGLAVHDAAPPTDLPDLDLPSAWGGRAAVVTSTNRVYVGHWSYLLPDLTVVAAIREHDEAEAVPIPLTVALSNDMVQADGSVVVNFEATSGFPTPLPIQRIFYQLDSVDGPWTPASPAGASASATVTLSPGLHTIHAFAVDGQEATIGHIQRRNPIVGPVASLDVEFVQPACSNGVDDDGDGLTDWPNDPGCRAATTLKENPKCDDDVDNDGDGGTDWDGGAQGLAPDAQCVATPWKDREVPAGGCGVGAEIALVLGFVARHVCAARRAVPA